MRCPFCGSEDINVVDSRPSEENNSIKRRRKCACCDRRFTTYEMVETIPIMIVKKDNTREKYSREKIEKGIVTSCHKRTVSYEQIASVVDEIESEIYAMASKEILSSDVGEIVMKHLKDLDQVAYVRFASVYREFQDVSTFMDEIGKLLVSDNETGEK